MELAAMNDEDLDTLRVDVLTEQERRQKIATIPDQMGSMNAAYLAAEGVQDGDSWEQPTGAHNSYPEGWTVEHDGKTWVSLTTANVWEPGNTADPQAYRWWEEDAPDPEPNPDTGRLPWDGKGFAYAISDEVDYEGAGYRVKQAHTSQPGWTPPAVPALYEVITD